MTYQSLQSFCQLTILAAVIIGGFATYGTYHYGKKIEDAKAAYDKILITPTEIIVPANSSREVPITVTNNYPYPVFMVVVEIEVEEGDVDLSKDFVPFGNGVWMPKIASSQIEQINSKQSFTHVWNIDGSKYENPSKIKLTVVKYLTEPPPNFTQHDTDSLPKKIELPKGFVPPINENDVKRY